MKEIARQCGVGFSTVQRALSDDPRVNAATREHILGVARDLGYNPAHHEAARRMALQRQGRRLRNQAIGLLMPSTFEEAPYFFRLFQGLVNVLAPQGYAVVTFSYSTSWHPADTALPSVFFRGEIDGLAAVGVPDDLLPLLTQLRKDPGFGDQRPIVSMINALPGVSTVTTDDLSGAYQATRHLLSLGHRHLLQFYQANFDKMSERLQGARLAMQEMGLTPEQHLHLFDLNAPSATQAWVDPAHLARISRASAPPKTGDAGSAHPLPVYFQAHPHVTAILALNDASAVQAWAVLEPAGLRVPDDISLIGFDDVETSVTLDGQLGLTTVRLPLVEIGRNTATRLLHAIESHENLLETMALPTELVIRKTTAPR